ncbi:MAG: tRNA lysidine(34) synthetase TilS [Thiopseudomonas sp.]|nr:tRNA lysidine(34) synthetase TilS [Thiopseudomonas sp.]MCK9464668.1 tRNA lysidine(34) synthetase TilS [Thiopseudomonas sp.]
MQHRIVPQVIEQLKPWQRAPAWCVAFSGGLDSTVLLHILATQIPPSSRPALRAVYIHHGLQQAAEDWPAHCQSVCEQLGVALSVIKIKVAQQASVEQAARNARYTAYAEHLQPEELLLMAQHQDDQAETLLFRLLRGSGVTGLQAIPRQRALGQAHLLRPLLGIARQELEDYAQQHQLNWVEDPSNAEEYFDRNFLRRQIIPLLKQRWPATLSVLQRTTEHMREAQQLLDDLAQLDLQQAQLVAPISWLPLAGLQLDKLAKLSDKRQKNLLRYWLADKTSAVETQHWAGWYDLRDAKADARPVWRLQQGALVRYQQQLYWLPESWLASVETVQLEITKPGRYVLPGNGVLEVQGELPGLLHIRYRHGGEQMQLPARGRRDLKRLLQEQNIPQFLRQRIPLVYMQQQLIAVANCCALQDAQAKQLQLHWHPLI